jgi:hypothetical protein
MHLPQWYDDVVNGMVSRAEQAPVDEHRKSAHLPEPMDAMRQLYGDRYLTFAAVMYSLD